MDFEPSGRGANRALRVINDGEQSIAVEISIVTREMDIDGRESYTEAENDFIIYPPQMVLAVGQVQTVCIRWVGEANPARELAYRLIAEQLPVNFDSVQSHQGQGAKINLLVRYVGSVYVIPTEIRPEVVLDCVEQEKGDERGDDQRLIITLHNRGTSHTILGDLKVRLTLVDDKDNAVMNSIILGPEQLEGINGENILAGHKRRFVLPWPEELGDGAVQVRFSFNPGR